MADHESKEHKDLRELFISVAKVSEDGHKINVGKAEAQYKWRIVYGLKSQWESYVPRFLGDKSRFYPLEFDENDTKGVIDYLASEEADRVMEERAVQKKRNGQSPA